MSDIQSLLDKHNKFYESILSFIPSENSCFIFEKLWKENLTNRYFFKDTKLRQSFPWQDYMYEIFKYVESKILKILEINYINLSPISWLSQMLLAIKSFWVNNWWYILSIPVEKWWHFITSELINSLWYKNINIPFLNNEIDELELTRLINSYNVKLVYFDQMTWVIPFWFSKKIKENIPSDVVFYNDISHNLAFIISWLHKNPLKLWFDAFWWSFHKSFPWPQKAFIWTNNEMLINKIDLTSKILFSNTHIWDLYDIWLVLDYMEWKWLDYTKNIIINVNLFWKIIENNWFKIIWKDKGIYSKNHQILFMLPKNFDTDIYVSKLKEVWVLVNNLILPFTNWQKWIRMWFQEATLLWLNKSDVKDLSSIFIWVLDKDCNINKYKESLKELKNKIINNKI